MTRAQVQTARVSSLLLLRRKLQRNYRLPDAFDQQYNPRSLNRQSRFCGIKTKEQLPFIASRQLCVHFVDSLNPNESSFGFFFCSVSPSGGGISRPVSTPPNWKITQQKFQLSDINPLWQMLFAVFLFAIFFTCFFYIFLKL